MTHACRERDGGRKRERGKREERKREREKRTAWYAYVRVLSCTRARTHTHTHTHTQDCVICFEALSSDALILRCKHIFHQFCILRSPTQQSYS